MRRSVRVPSVCLALVLCVACPCPAKEWRGIMPLKSTRADVIRLLGEPKHLPWDYRDFFILGDEVVTFKWVDPSCVRKYPVEPDAEVRPGDLVLSISVTPRKPLPYGALHLDSRALESPTLEVLSSGCATGRECIFVDEEEGFGYTASEVGVTSHSYWAAVGGRKAWMQTHGACKPTS